MKKEEEINSFADTLYSLFQDYDIKDCIEKDSCIELCLNDEEEFIDNLKGIGFIEDTGRELIDLRDDVANDEIKKIIKKLTQFLKEIERKITPEIEIKHFDEVRTEYPNEITF